jgi:hypothetical protein
MSSIWLPFIECQVEWYDEVFEGIWPFWKHGINHFSVTLALHIIIGQFAENAPSLSSGIVALAWWVMAGIMSLAISLVLLLPSRTLQSSHTMLYLCSGSSVLFMSISSVVIPFALIRLMGSYTARREGGDPVHRSRALVLAIYRCTTYCAGTVSHPISAAIQDRFGYMLLTGWFLLLCVMGLLFSALQIIFIKESQEGRQVPCPRAHNAGIAALCLFIIGSVLINTLIFMGK